MKIIQLSDCHLFASPAQLGYSDINPAQSLEQVLSEALSLQPDGLLFTGDISADDSIQSYQLFLSILNSCAKDLPWRVIPGNHDNNPYFNQLLKANWLQAGQAWECGGVFVHGLDTRYEGTQGLVDSQQLTQITNDIRRNEASEHLLAIHHHPVATHSWMDKHALHNIAALEEWLQSKPVKAVLHGHIHAATNGELAGTPVLGVPSSSWQWQLSSDFAIDQQAAGFRLIECENHKLSTRIQRVSR